MKKKLAALAIGSAVAASALFTAPALAGQTKSAANAEMVAMGKKQFLRCTACHATTASAPGKIGPHLDKVVGRKAGTAKGFNNYSDAMKKTDFVWDEKKLDAFLIQPTKVVPGTSMAFPGLNSPEQRASIIAYLKTLK